MNKNQRRITIGLGVPGGALKPRPATAHTVRRRHGLAGLYFLMASSPVVKDVDPAGTPGVDCDYNSLSDWWNAVKFDDTPNQWAQCYGSGDLGPLDTTGTPYFITASGSHPKVFAASGEGHVGMWDDNKAKIVTGTNPYIAGQNYIEIKGIQVKITSGSTQVAASGVVFDSCYFWAVADGGCVDLGSDYNVTTIRNCIMHNSNNSGGSAIFNQMTTGNVCAHIANNTIVGGFQHAIDVHRST